MPDLCRVVLCFLWTHVALAVVPSPTNVKLHCHNFDNRLTWGYDEFPSGLQFKVEISCYSNDKDCNRPQWVEPPKLEANLSHLSDPNNDYLVTVKAVMGQNESEPPLDGGIDFSYNKMSLVSQHCSVDLPPLTATPLPDHKLRIQFQHPWEFYKPKLQKCKKQKCKRQTEIPTFKYHVMVLNETETLYCEQSVCEKDLQLDPKEKHCVAIKGTFSNVLVKSRGDHCIEPLKEYNPYIYVVIVIVIVTVAVTMVILVMVYRKKTRPSTALPHFMKRFILVKPPTVPGLQDPFHPLEVEPSSPTPLIFQTDMEDVDEANTSNYDSRSSPLPIQEGFQDREEGESPAYMDGRTLEENEGDEEKGVFHSDYERRSLPNNKDLEEK